MTTRTEAGVVVRTPFAGNIIPEARINPIGLALASYFPTARRTARYLGDLNYTGSGSLFDRANQQTGKPDQVSRTGGAPTRRRRRTAFL